MNSTLKNIIIAMVMLIIAFTEGNLYGQLDDRFGVKGVEGTVYLGTRGLSWYRDWNDSYLRINYPPSGKNKIWTVGKIDYRTDGLGMDWRWLILGLLEDTDVDLLQNLLNLCLAIVDTNIVPIIGDYWTKARPLLETQLEDTLNHFTYIDVKYGIKYRARCKKTDIAFQEQLPEFVLTVKQDTIFLNTNISVDWTTHIYIEAWLLNPNPFDWGYHWKDIGDADCKFKTTIYISGFVGLEGQGRDRHLQIKRMITDARTESDIDWTVFGISFAWEELSNAIEDVVDDEIETAMNKELNKKPITDPYYLTDFFKSLFAGGQVPTQQEILDRIWDKEQGDIIRVIKEDGYEQEYWSIGYEPNWFPMLKPTQYAEYFVKYYRLIKTLDSNAKIMGPSIFLTEAIENPGEIAWQFIPAILQGPLIGIKDEFKSLIVSYFNMADSKIWYREFIDHLPADVKLAVNDFHIFPMNLGLETVEWDSIACLMDDIALFMRNVSQVEEVWISEFGNTDIKRSATEAAELCRNFCHYLKSNTVGIKRWFWFLSCGHSPFYDIPLAPKPPQTALLNKDFTLTPIGKVYLLEADCTPPIMVSAPTDAGKSQGPGKVGFSWTEAKEYDTGITNYQLEVRAEPGNLTIFSQWVGNKWSHSINYDAPKTLFARVRAKNGADLVGDWSGWSDGIQIKTTDSTDIELVDGLNDSQKTNQTSFRDENTTDSSKIHLLPATIETNDDQIRVNSVTVEIPNSFELLQNYPNPFNSSTTINYQMPVASHVLIKIYNAHGQEINTLVDEFKTAAYYSVQWNGRDENNLPVPTGIYLYQIYAGNYKESKKMVVLR